MSVWNLGIAEIEKVLFFPHHLNINNKFDGDFSSLSIHEILKIIRLFHYSKIKLIYFTDVSIEQTRTYALFTYIGELTSKTVEFIPYEGNMDFTNYWNEAKVMKINSIKSYLTCNYRGMDFRKLKHVYCDDFTLLNDWGIINDLPLNSVIITKKEDNYSKLFNVMYVTEKTVIYDSERIDFEGMEILSLTSSECQTLFKQLVNDHVIHYLLPEHDLIRDLVPKMGVATLNLLYIHKDGVYCKFKDSFLKLGDLHSSLNHIELKVTLLTDYSKLKYIDLMEAVMYYTSKFKYEPCYVDHILLLDNRRELLVENLWEILIVFNENNYVIVDMKKQHMKYVNLKQFDYKKIVNHYNERSYLDFATDIGFTKKIKQILLGSTS